MNTRWDRIRKRLQNALLAIASAILVLLVLMGCGPSAEELEAVEYTPPDRDDWGVSTPADQGLDPMLVAELYHKANEVETINGLLLVKGGKLIGEKYFNGGEVDKKSRVQSVTKSFTSALAGMALQQGCLKSVDQRMIEFFPELEGRIKDPRKKEITVRDMLQMRAGYPWEESSDALFELLYSGFRPSNLVDVPLNKDPGSGMEYSNLTSHLLGVVIARACDSDLKSMAEEYIFGPLGMEPGEWIVDWEGYYNGHADLHLSPRDMAKFGLLYLNDGAYEGEQIVAAEWVHDSLQTYSEDAWPYRVGKNFRDIGYGYQWWSVRAGDHHYNLAWGHGGQQIAVLDEYDMVVVVVADPLFGQHGDEPWKHEKANLNLVADFISSLPSE